MTRIAPGLPEPTTGFIVVGAVTEVAIGAALGFVVHVLFAAVQYAGDLIDLTGGFSLQPAYDPLSMTTSSSVRSEEHTSELQSRQYLVCRLLLEKKNRTQ